MFWYCIICWTFESRIFSMDPRVPLICRYRNTSNKFTSQKNHPLITGGGQPCGFRIRRLGFLRLQFLKLPAWLNVCLAAIVKVFLYLCSPKFDTCPVRRCRRGFRTMELRYLTACQIKLSEHKKNWGGTRTNDAWKRTLKEDGMKRKKRTSGGKKEAALKELRQRGNALVWE